MKRKTGFFLLVCLLAFLTVFGVFAEAQYDEGNWKYTVLDDHTVRIDMYFGQETEVTVPASLGSFPVVRIRNAFALSDVETVTLPESVEYIENGAFFGCTSLRSIVSPGVKRICSHAFGNCVSLTDIELSNAEVIENESFLNCCSLSELALPNIRDIGYAAFLNCTGLQKVQIGDKLFWNDEDAFVGVNETILPEELRPRYLEAFQNDSDIEARCRELIQWRMDQLKKEIAGCTRTEENDTWRYTWNVLGCRIKRYLGSETEVTIPEKIGTHTVTGLDGTFTQSNVEKVEIPATVTMIDDYSFAECTSLKAVSFYGEKPTIRQELKIGEGAFYQCTDLESTGLEEIESVELDSLVFYGCSSLKALSLQQVSYVSNFCFFRSGISDLKIDQLVNASGASFVGLPRESLHITAKDKELSNFSTGTENQYVYDGDEIYWHDQQRDNKGENYVNEFLLFSPEVVTPDRIRDIRAKGDEEGLYFVSASEDAFYEVKNKISLARTAIDDGQWQYGFLEDGTATILAYRGTEAYVKIPTTLGGQPVTVIWGKAFEKNRTAQTVEMPDTVERICKQAFTSCTGLMNVKWSAGLKIVESSAFENVETVLQIPEYVDYVSYSPIRYTKRKDRNGFVYLRLPDGTINIIAYEGPETTKIVIPENLEEDRRKVTVIGGHLREVSGIKDNGFKTATEIVLPPSIVKIDKEAFDGNTNLRKINLPSGLETVGELAFSGCTALEMNASEFPKTLKNIGESAWRDCEKLKGKVSLSANGRYGKYAFEGSSITSAVIEEGVEVLPDAVFAYCKLKNVRLPSTLREIGAYAFSGNSALQLKTADLPQSIVIYGNSAFSNTDLSGKFTLEPEKDYGKGAFFGTGITSVVVRDGVTCIQARLFENCHQLVTVDLGHTVETINEYAFDSTGLKSVVLPASLTTLSIECFGNCDYLSSVDASACPEVEIITDSTESYGYRTEYQPFTRSNNAVKKKELVILAAPGTQLDEYYSNKAGYKVKLVIPTQVIDTPAGSVLHSGWAEGLGNVYRIAVPEGVEEIGNEAFAGMKSLVSVQLPSTLKRIDDRAFADCSNLKEIALPGSLEALGEECFRNCAALTDIVIPDDVTILPRYVFAESLGLTSVKLSPNLTEIQEYAFAGCTSLKTIKLPKKLSTLGKACFAFCPSLTGIVIPADVTVIPSFAFQYDTELKNVTLPDGLIEIENNAFEGCNTLSELTLPSSLEKIGNETFMLNPDTVAQYYRNNKKASKLITITIPAAVTEIGDRAFAGQDALTTVTFAKNSRLKKLGEQAFIMCLRLPKVDLGRCGELEMIGSQAFALTLAMKELTVSASVTDFGEQILADSNEKLIVTVSDGSPAEQWMKESFPDIKIKKKKQ